MLTVGRREDGMKGLGFRAEGGGRGGGLMMEEENELEEGEAYCVQEDYSCIDPDSFSYIDLKVNDVLGHLRKDFEGGVSAENLGAKFGGYGSFLPTYQRSPPIFSQPKSPQKLASHNVVQSPYNSSLEVLRQYPLVTATSRSNNTGASALNNSAKKENCRITNSGDPISQQNSSNKPVSGGGDTSSLKVRLRLGPENNLCRAAIYSGLGLDMSPSSSYEDSPDGSAEISPEYMGVHGESPNTIIQIMTCFSGPDLLLSPLQDNLIYFIEKDISMKKCQAKGSMPGNSAISKDLTLPGVEFKSKADKKIKSGEKKGRITEVRDSRGKDDIGTILQSDIDIETPAGQELVFNALSIALLSGSRSDEEADGLVVGNVASGGTNSLDDSRRLNKATKKDRMGFPNYVGKKQLDMTETITNNVAGNLAGTFVDSRRKMTGKQSITLKPLEAQSTNNHMNAPSRSSKRDCKSKTEKGIEMSNSHTESSGYKMNEQYAELSDHSKRTSSQKISSREVGGEKVHWKNQTSDRKIKLNVTHSNSEPSREASKDNSSGNSSAALKEQGKSSQATSVQEPNNQKSRKELNGLRFRESRVDVIGDTDVEQMDAGVFPSDMHSRGNQKALKSHPEKEPIVSSKMVEKISGKRVGETSTNRLSTGEPLSAPLMGNGPSSEAVVGTQAPVVIKEDWVHCDICHKWRLLPYGTNPRDLPKRWQCRLLNWLPGMNSCSISEDETTRALNAMYSVPPPVIGDSLNSHHDVAIPNASSASRMHIGQNTEVARTAPATGKKKSISKDASNGQFQSTQAQILVSKNQQTLHKSKSSNDANRHSIETDSYSKGRLGISSKSMDLYPDEQRKNDKHLVDAIYPDEGYLVGKSGKCSSSKSKRELHADDTRFQKKPKKESPLYLSRDWHASDVVAEKAFEDNTRGHLVKTTPESHLGRNEFPLAKDSKLDVKAKSSKKSKDYVQAYCKGMEEHISGSDVERSGHHGFSTKKRKLIEWQESQMDAEAPMAGQVTADHQHIHDGTLNENELAKNKKAKLSKSDGKISRSNKMDARMDKKDKATKNMLPVNAENLPGSVDDDAKYVGKERELSQWQGGRGYRRDLDFDSLNRDAGFVQASGAANSSSSKVSGSRRNKTETKGSPVESVSSSPLRPSNKETFPSKKRILHENEEKTTNSSGKGSPKRCTNNVADGVSNRSGKVRKESAFPVQRPSAENHMATNSFLRGTHAYKEKDKAQLCVGKSAENVHSKRDSHDEHIPTELGNANLVGYTSNLVDEKHKHLHENACREDIEELDKNTKHHVLNISTQRKSGKNSSGSKERHKGTNYEVDAGKLKVSSSSSENRDTRYPENGFNNGHELDRISRDNATIPKASRNEIHIQEKKIKKDCVEKKSNTSDCLAGIPDNSSSLVRQNPVDHSELPILPKATDSRPPIVGGRFPKNYMHDEHQVSSSQNREKGHNSSSDKIDRATIPSEQSRSQINLPPEDKSASRSQGHGIVSSPFHGSKSEKCGVGVNNEASKLVKQLRQSDGHHALHHTSLRHSTPGGPDSSSPMRKDSHSSVMKEARDLKHTANRLKNEGLELDSTGIYFEAAMKFLHCASLMEPAQGDAAQMYSETAKLCEFVAHEYEKFKEMAAAALAYKCVEVAYFKAAYWKNPNASKDRHDLQIALQILPPGESPSSSASDVDNLNHQSTLGKTASAKGVNSPQVGNNHVGAARLHPQVLRLLHYTNDVNCAFEATRKSQIAIAAASVNLTKDMMDGISSVRKVLDFNFHNVDELLRLVRLSKESIGR